MQDQEKGASDRTTTGRWVAEEHPPNPYEPPAIRARPMRFVTPAELGQGYEVIDEHGRAERRDYVVLAHVVVDPKRET